MIQAKLVTRVRGACRRAGLPGCNAGTACVSWERTFKGIVGR